MNEATERHQTRERFGGVRWFTVVAASFAFALAASAVTSALISRQLDTLQTLKLDTTLPDAMLQIGNQTGVRLEADPVVWDLLPWGEQTSIRATVQNRTLRQGLTAITQKLGLEFVLTDDAVQIRPIPALRRLGRRATVDELGVLDLLAGKAIDLPGDHPTVREIASAVDDRLSKLNSPFSIDNRADAAADQKISIAKNATLADALEDLVQQSDVSWYPTGKTILLISKEAQVRDQLSRPITARYNGVDVPQVLLELFARAGVNFTVEPGAYQKVPPQYRSITLMLDNASTSAAVESIGGYTGLSFEISQNGVRASYTGQATTRPAAR